MANSISICLNDSFHATAKNLERSLQAPTQLLVIDARVDSFSTLANGVHPSAKVLVLDSEQNGIMRISQVLRSNPSITTLNILAHGVPGCIYLGNTPLDSNTLTHHSWELSTWFARALNPQIHLYSCNVALGYSGIEFIQTLHRLTKTSIAASTTLIGRTDSGSNWQLNYRLGQIDIQNPIAPDILESYQGVLAPPAITDAVTTPRSTSEETVIGITGVTISDTDGGIQTVTVSVSEGGIALATGSGVTVTGSTATSITFTGTIAQVNAAINGMNYAPSLNYADDTTLTISSNDGTTTVTKAVAIAVTPVNDTPTIAPSAATVAEGGNVNFVATNFGIADVDNIAAQIIVKVAALPGKGFLVLDGGKLAVGSSFSSDRIPDLKYVHDGTQTTAIGGTSDSFSITVADGAGGIISSTAIPIVITPVNQLPTVIGSATLFEGESNKPVTLTISDLDQTAANYTIKILSQPINPAHGTLTFNGIAVVVGQTFSSADLANLKYSHFGNDENFGNPPNVTFDIEVLDDGGGTGIPGAKTATVTLGITANNDDPILDINTGITLDTTSVRKVVITNANLKVTDPDSGILQLTYTVSQSVDPTLGSLQLNGSKIGIGATFTQADINQGRLEYVFNKNTTAGDTFTDSFKFEVRDSSITEFPTVREGGIYSGAVIAENTFTINISTPNAITDATGSNDPTVVANTAPVITNNLGIGQPVGGSPTLNEGGSVGITSAMLSVTDPDNSPEQLVYRIEKSPTNGTFKLNGNPVSLYGSFTQKDINDGKVSFQHEDSEDFIDIDITFSVSDGINLLKNQKFKLDVIPKNDAPVVTVGTTVSLAENTEQTITTANFSLSDVDGSGEKIGQGFATVNSFTFKVTELPINGSLYIDQGSGYVKIDVSNFGTLIITNNQLTSGKLKYVHAGDENVADSFKVQALDDSGAPNNSSSVQTINIEIAKINDAPVLSGPVINLTVAEAGTGTIKGSNALVGEPRLVYTDPDNTTIQRQYAITSKTTHGAILLNGKTLAVGSVFTQDDLDNNRVTYKHDGTEFYADSFNFEVRDGAALPVPGSYGITITPTNDSPTLTVPATQTFATTAPLVFSTANSNSITFADPDLVALDVGETDIISVTLDLQAASATYTGSTLTLGSTTGVTVTSGTNGIAGGKIIFEGTKADIQAALEGLQVQVPADEDRIVSLVVTVNDQNNGGPDAPIPQPTTVTKTIDIKASNVNDIPTIPTIPASVTVAEDTFLSFTGANAIAIQDVDSFSTINNTVTLSVTQGTLNLTPGAATISGGANGTGTITLTGSLADINAAIASLLYKGNPEYNGSDSLSVVFNDAGNLGTGGAQSVTQNISITVTPINDTPTIAAPSATLAIEDGNPLTFSGANLISVDDAKDLGSNGNGLDTFTVTVDALNGITPYGTVQATTGTGATITLGGSPASITISGTKAQVNAALNGLTYTPADSNIDATVSLNVTVKDQANGGTAIGGTVGELTATTSISINVSGINDAPILTAPTSVTATEDTQFTFAANSLKVDDPDDFGKPLKVTLTVGNGTLTFGSTTGLTVTGSGANIVVQGKESDINNALNTLKYQGTLNYNTIGASKDTLTLLVDDLGNSGTGGAKTTTKIVDINVTPVNDAPIASGSVTVTAVLEDSTNPTGTDISTLLSSNYSDVADTVTGGSMATSLAGIAIVGNAATAAQGTWQHFNGSIWTNVPTSGLSSSSALVVAASEQLRFVPTANFNGVPGSLAIRLSDGTSFTTGSGQNVGTGGGSSGWSASTVAVGTSITAVNDAPVATGSSSLAVVLEDATNPAGATVTSLFLSKFSDSTDQVTGGSSANTFAGIAIASNTANPLTEGKWQYFNGAWIDVGTRSTSSALLVTASDKLRFLPAANFNGTPPGLIAHLIDNSSGAVTSAAIVDLSGGGATGGTTRFSSSAVPLTTSITAVNDVPLFTKGADQTVNEDAGIQTVSSWATGLSAGPSDESGQTLSFIATNNNNTLFSSQPSIDATGKLVYTPAANANGVAIVTVKIKDSGGVLSGGVDASATQTFTITINPVADSPSGADKTITTNEDTSYTLTTLDFGFTDPDTSDTLSAVRIDSLPINGTFKLNGVDVTTGQEITAADIAANKLVFTPATNANGAAYANFNFSVKDSSGDVSTQFDLAPNKITFNVTAVNDPPSGTDKTVTTNEDTGYTFTTGDFGFSDPDGHTFTDVRIDSLPASGTLKLNGVIVTATQVITVADVTSGKLVFTPAANATGAAYANFNFSVKDSSNAFDAAPNKITVNVTAVNDPPTGQDKTITAVEDTGYALVTADFGFADIDGDSLSSVRIDTLPTNGTLKLNGTSVTGGQDIAVADITAGNLVFTAAPDANGASYANFNFSVKDSSGLPATEFDLAPNKITFNVTAKNDPPTGQDKTITAIEDTGYALTVADFGFADIDTGDSLSGVRIDTLPTNGTLKLNGVLVTAGQIVTTADITANKLVFTAATNANGNSYANFTFSVRDSSGDPATQFDLLPNTIIFDITPANDPPTGQDKILTMVEDTGYALTVADLGFADIDGDTLSGVRIDTLPNGTLKLNGILVTAGQIILTADITAGNLVFTPTLNTNGNNNDTFTFSVQDSSGDVLTQFDTAPNTLTFNVTPANDPPTGQDKTIPSVEDTPYVFTTSDFGFSDIDPGDTLSGVRIDSQPASGTFKFNSVDVTLGQVISAADLAAGKLIFTPAANTSGNNAFNFSVRDSSGNLATEFDPVPNTIILNVSPVNDPPTGQDNTISIVEDTGYPLTAIDFGFSDIDPGDIFSSVRIDTTPNGTLKLSGILVTVGQVISAGDITAGNLVFTPALNANGNDTFTFSVKDSSGNTTSEFDTAPNTLTFNVTPANDPPNGQDKAIAPSEDTPYIFTTSDFGFSDIDPGDILSSVRIDTPPASGTFTLHGVAIAPGQIISATDITAGKLIFTPAPNTNGNNYAAFTFSVRDSSGDSATEFDPSPNTITFNVTAQNDPPTGQDKTITTVEDTGYPLTTADFGFSDVDAGDTLSGVRIDSLPGGRLKLSGVGVSVGQVISGADIIAGNLIFTPALNSTSNDTFTFSVRDSSGDIATEFDTAPNTLTFNVTPVNDPPTGQDKTVPTVEDTLYIFTTSDFGFSDVDPGDTLSGIRIDTLPTSGTFTLNGVAIAPGQIISAADIVAGKLIFTSALNTSGTVLFTFSVRDSSGDLATEFDTVSNTITVNVAPSNDPPTGQDKTISTLEDTSYSLTTADFGFSDIDGDTFQGVRVDTLPNGILKLNGVTVTTGQFISATDITAGNLVFTPVVNASGNDVFTFSVRDSSGEVATEFDTAPNTITFDVTPINDSPTGQDKAIATLQNAPYTFTTSDFGFTDVDPGDTLSGVRIDTTSPNGTFQLNGVAVTPGQVISPVDIAAGKLVFTPALNATGLNYANFTFSVKDSSGNATTEFDPVPNTISISVDFINTPPTGQDKIITTPEDISYGLTTSDFGFGDIDAGDSLSGVRLDTLPTSGALKLNGASTAVGQIISATDIAAGQLVFIPVPNANGNNYATFDFSVRDSSGDVPSQFDDAPNTITFNVASVNDSPTGQDKAIATPEDTAYVFTPTDFGFNDSDLGDTLSGVRIDTPPTSGTLALNGAPITPGQVISAADITAGKFSFTPALNANGATTFTFSVRDSSSDPTSEFDPAPNQITFNVAPIKDAPTGQDKTISATGGIGYSLTPNDFSFADADSDTFSDVRIDTLPVNGTFQLNGANVTAEQVISTTDIAAGKLVFTVVPDTNGANYANFTFSVKDNSGDVSTEFDTVPNTITFNVASNLPPIIDLDGNNSSGITGDNYQVLYTSGQLAKIADTDVKITDVDDLNMESATLILTTRPNGASESLALTGTLPGGINASAYDPLTGILKLTGSASIADYQAAIASITYKNTTVAKDTSNRTVTVMVNDGEKDSSLATTTILFDSDGDRSSDSSDLDDDNDGIPDLIEQNGNPNRDTDGDGILDTLDLDADNDGITDLQESGLSTTTIAILDKDNNGVIDPTNNFGSNGLSNALETTPDSGILNYTPVDTDGDKKPNFQDLDSDNDGLTDLFESGSGYLDGNSDKMVDGIDSDGDGILDLADKGTGFGGGSRPPLKDSNNNGIPDFMEISVSPPKGSNGSDTIIGTDGDDILNGFSDLDIIYGRGGNDLINGGSDRDVLRGDEGNDTINGGTDNDDIQGGTGNDIISGGDGDDLILGNDGDDALSGDRGNDRIYGSKSKDIINGGDGNDRLYGDEDDDIVRGDRGNDLLVGGVGKDELTGGQGRDIFRYRSVKEFGDVVTDFEIVKDRFDLRKIFHHRGSMSNIELQQSGKDTIVGVSFKGKEYNLGTLEDVNANTLKARHFKF